MSDRSNNENSENKTLEDRTFAIRRLNDLLLNPNATVNQDGNVILKAQAQKAETDLRIKDTLDFSTKINEFSELEKKNYKEIISNAEKELKELDEKERNSTLASFPFIGAFFGYFMFQSKRDLAEKDKKDAKVMINVINNTDLKNLQEEKKLVFTDRSKSLNLNQNALEQKDDLYKTMHFDHWLQLKEELHEEKKRQKQGVFIPKESLISKPLSLMEQHKKTLTEVGYETKKNSNQERKATTEINSEKEKSIAQTKERVYWDKDTEYQDKAFEDTETEEDFNRFNKDLEKKEKTEIPRKEQPKTASPSGTPKKAIYVPTKAFTEVENNSDTSSTYTQETKNNEERKNISPERLISRPFKKTSDVNEEDIKFDLSAESNSIINLMEEPDYKEIDLSQKVELRQNPLETQKKKYTSFTTNKQLFSER